MRSRAAIGKHPIHPMLVPIPIGAFFLALFGDLLRMASPADRFWYDFSYTCIGIGLFFALLAAAAGAVDYVGVTMSAKAFRTATRHLLLNLSMVIFYLISFFARRVETGASSGRWLLAFGTSVAGFVLLGVSGWLGGKLAHEFRVGVDEEEIDAPPSASKRASAAS